MKTFGFALVNAILSIITYYVIGNILYVFTKQFIDRINPSSIATIGFCLLLLVALCLIESRKLKLSFVVLFSASLTTLGVFGIGIAFGV